MLVALMPVGWTTRLASCRGLDVREAEQSHVKHTSAPEMTAATTLFNGEATSFQWTFHLFWEEKKKKKAPKGKQGQVDPFLKVP